MGRSVLIVDDDPEFRDLAATVVTAWGHAVLGQAATAEDALDDASTLRPQVALVDVSLPDGNGMVLASRLRDLPHPPDVILISSDADATTQHAAHRAGAEAFVPKHELTGGRLRDLMAGRAP